MKGVPAMEIMNRSVRIEGIVPVPVRGTGHIGGGTAALVVTGRRGTDALTLVGAYATTCPWIRPS